MQMLLINMRVNSDGFIDEWKSLSYLMHYNGFLQMQHDYIKSEYYDTACRYLANNGFMLIIIQMH